MIELAYIYYYHIYLIIPILPYNPGIASTRSVFNPNSSPTIITHQLISDMQTSTTNLEEKEARGFSEETEVVFEGFVQVSEPILARIFEIATNSQLTGETKDALKDRIGADAQSEIDLEIAQINLVNSHDFEIIEDGDAYCNTMQLWQRVALILKNTATLYRLITKARKMGTRDTELLMDDEENLGVVLSRLQTCVENELKCAESKSQYLSRDLF